MFVVFAHLSVIERKIKTYSDSHQVAIIKNSGLTNHMMQNKKDLKKEAVYWSSA